LVDRKDMSFLRKLMRCIDNVGREEYLTVEKVYKVYVEYDLKYPQATLMSDIDVIIVTPPERFEKIKFEEIVDKFISKHGIRTVVLNTKYINDNRCDILLRGGYLTSVEVIGDILYKDDMSYCIVEELFG